MDEDKKITAAISAVMQYLKAEEEMAGFSTGEGILPSSRQNAWGSSGRQAQMDARAMVSMKAVRPKVSGSVRTGKMG